MPRILLLLLNAVAFGFLLSRIVRIAQWEVQGTRRVIKLTAGILLLLLPVTILAGFIKPTPVYLLVYPIGIGAFIYLSRL